jgi:hypothetical protein
MALDKETFADNFFGEWSLPSVIRSLPSDWTLGKDSSPVVHDFSIQEPCM